MNNGGRNRFSCQISHIQPNWHCTQIQFNSARFFLFSIFFCCCAQFQFISLILHSASVQQTTRKIKTSQTVCFFFFFFAINFVVLLFFVNAFDSSGNECVCVRVCIEICAFLRLLLFECDQEWVFSFNYSMCWHTIALKMNTSYLAYAHYSVLFAIPLDVFISFCLYLSFLWIVVHFARRSISFATVVFIKLNFLMIRSVSLSHSLGSIPVCHESFVFRSLVFLWSIRAKMASLVTPIAQSLYRQVY